MAEMLALAKDKLRAQGMAEAAALAQRAVSGEVGNAELLAGKSKIPTWRPRSFLTPETPVGKPYQWEDIVYKLLQQHDASSQPDWTPDKVPALWAAVSPEESGTRADPIPAVRGMEYQYGRYYLDPEDSKIYLCKRTGEMDGGKVILQYLPHELIGQYFEAAQP